MAPRNLQFWNALDDDAVIRFKIGDRLVEARCVRGHVPPEEPSGRDVQRAQEDHGALHAHAPQIPRQNVFADDELDDQFIPVCRVDQLDLVDALIPAR